MLKNYFTIAFRNFVKNKVYSSINVAGFSIGLACAFLIALFVYKELSYDRFHSQASHIYRLTEVINTEGVGEASASVSIPVGPTLKQNHPDLVKASARLFNFNAPSLNLAYTPDPGKSFNETRLFFTDPDFFTIFDFTLKEGNRRTVLSEPNSIVLTQEMAKKYFGDENPMGKILRFEDKHELKVTGILNPVPAQSHFQFDFLVSFITLRQILHETQYNSWYWNPAWTYLLLADHEQARSTLEKQLPDFVKTYFPDIIKNDTELGLQPLTDIYLHSSFYNEIEPTSRISYVYIFSVIGLFILFIASINFMNLTTARSANRAKEVGVRKVLGSQKNQLVTQFLSESVLLAIIVWILAIGIVFFTIPPISRFSGRNLHLNIQEIFMLLPSGLLIALVVGLLSGLYPAFYLSAFRPLYVLKGFSATKGARGGLLRKTLVVVQFSLSILLIIGTMVAYFQLGHLQQANLGFNKEQVLIIPINRSAISTINRFNDFKKRLLQNSRIVSITAMEEVLGRGHNTGHYQPEGKTEELLFSRMVVREDFTETFNIPILAGRGFSEKHKPDPLVREVIVNEAMLRYLNWPSAQEAIGKKMGEFTADSLQGTVRIVGVAKDFHATSLHQDITPLVLVGPPVTDPANQFFIKFMAVRVAPGDAAPVIDFIEKEWNNAINDRAFEYTFLDENLNRLYQAEAKFGGITLAFTVLAICIASLGLFGLATFTAEQRTKEIGIRKVLGASVGSITLLLSKDFLKLVLLSFIIASPIAWYMMYQWLESFAYRIEIAWWMFALSGVLAMLIALGTVSFRSIKAALSNPVKSLRNE